MKFECLLLFIIFIEGYTASAQNDSKDYYTPKSLIIPLHDEKNQLHTSFGRGGGFDFNISYAFSDKFAVFTTGTYDIGTKRRSTIFGSPFKIEKNDHSFKGGLGYFTTLNSKILEIYLGAGSTKIDNMWYFETFPESGELTEASYNTIFAQLNSGKKLEKSDFSLGIRLSYSMYSDFRFSSTHPNNRYIKHRYENARGLSADAVASYSYKSGKLKLNAQAGFAFPLTRASATLISEHTTNAGTTVITSQDDIALSALLGRISLQYDFRLRE